MVKTGSDTSLVHTLTCEIPDSWFSSRNGVLLAIDVLSLRHLTAMNSRINFEKNQFSENRELQNGIIISFSMYRTVVNSLVELVLGLTAQLALQSMLAPRCVGSPFCLALGPAVSKSGGTRPACIGMRINEHSLSMKLGQKVLVLSAIVYTGVSTPSL